MKIDIRSEIGTLEGVILHTPGPEVENMTPKNAERALYSDILNLPVAQKEYAQLSDLLKGVTHTYQVGDLLDVLAMQDSIADTAQDIAGLLMERKMDVPQGMGEPLMALVTRCVDTCNQASKIIEELDELVQIGFGGREANKVEDMVDALNSIEDETDEMGMQLARSLFAQEDTMSPVSVMFWYQMIQWIGDLADYAEKVGDRLRLLLAR